MGIVNIEFWRGIALCCPVCVHSLDSETAVSLSVCMSVYMHIQLIYYVVTDCLVTLFGRLGGIKLGFVMYVKYSWFCSYIAVISREVFFDG